MTTTLPQPIFHVDGATEGTTQWKAESMQMVNWGGFHGHHQVAFSPTATLISGASGTGKSTLLDAYLALMMPSDTPFNGASNEAQGRARSADQRNLVTYLKGKMDSARGDDGEMHDAVLRGANSSTWGAIGMTYVDDNQRRYTVLRAYFVPKHASKMSDITMKMCTVEGAFDLRDLEEVASSRFDKRTVRAQFPALTMFDTYSAFAQTLHTRLGIGANGDGDKALRLLAKIQAGEQFRTVDGLYKSMVLEQPGTFAAADKALAHFADLEEAYEAMATEASKVKVLERVPELHAEYTSAVESLQLIDTFGVHTEGDTPFSLWQLRTEERLLDAAVAENRRRHTELDDRYLTCRARVTSLRDGLESVREQQRNNGGDSLARMGIDLEKLQLAHDEAVRHRTQVLQRTAALDLPLTSAEDCAAAQAEASRYLSEYQNVVADLDERRTTVQRELWPLEETRREYRAELESLSGRSGLVPAHLHRARLMIAEAAGLDPSELPFVAELIDLAPGEERWRTAAEVVLDGVARLMLVDERKLNHLSQAIDPLKLPTRIRFEGVELRGFVPVERPDDRISGKLVYQDSPFSSWVQKRVQGDSIDALCVEDPRQLHGVGARVTLSGQTRRGRSGAHGDMRRPPIIGFNNASRLAELTAQVAAVEEQIAIVQDDVRFIGEELTRAQALRDAHQVVLDTQWEDIDVVSLSGRIATLTAQRDRMVTSSDLLRELRAQETQLLTELNEAERDLARAEAAADELDAAHEAMVDRQDAITADMERVERADQVRLTQAQCDHLDELCESVGDLRDVAAFRGTIKRLRERLGEQSAAAREQARKASDSLTRVFEAYQERWPDPNLGTSLLSVEGYQRILDHIVSTGLMARQDEWRRRLAQWSGQDLVPLHGAFETAIEEIEERLIPVNDILGTLPFGPTRDRLRIALRRLHREDVVEFRRELRALSAGGTEALDDEQVHDRFHRLRAFMDVIRRPTEGSPTSSQRDHVLDVRRHVEVTAVRVTVDGTEVSTYSSLGGKSGGETQELIAFIVGAALRFQLGDESRTRPRFAPVLLDEGFVKSDAEFAGRAVSAWKGLGFQLIVGAPLDKVTALEPYMDVVLTVTKNRTSGLSYISALSGETPAG